MVLLVQIGGALVLSTLLGLLVLGGAGRSAIVGASVLAVAVAGLAFWGGVWSTGRMFIEQAGAYPSTHDGNVAPGSLYPADENLLTPAEAVIPRDARVYLICLPSSVGCSSEWISYQLSPRLFVDDIQEAQYVLVYGASPRTVGTTAQLPVVLELSDGGVVRTKR